jgi:hypothetical protein
LNKDFEDPVPGEEKVQFPMPQEKDEVIEKFYGWKIAQ